jgi:hypothetical protein
MRRRDLLGLVGGGLVLPPFGVAAQQNKTASALAKVPRIGFIAPGSQETGQDLCAHSAKPFTQSTRERTTIR